MEEADKSEDALVPWKTKNFLSDDELKRNSTIHHHSSDQISPEFFGGHLYFEREFNFKCFIYLEPFILLAQS